MVHTPSPSLQGLLWAQFTEAFTDNAWKLIVFTLATRSLLPEMAWNDEAARISQTVASLSILTFLIPMLLFALPAGAIADRWSKRTIILAMKGIGLILMALATVVLLFLPHNLWVLFLILALMGAQSATFNPAKYGILPEMLPVERLAPANGVVQMVTMLAIIMGTGLGPVLLYFDKGGVESYLTWTAPFVLTLMALGAFLAALTIPKVPAAAASNNKTTQPSAFAILLAAWRAIRSDKVLQMAVLGTALFWTMTSLTGQNLLVYSQSLVHQLEHGELWQGVPTAAFGIGIAIGAIMAGNLCGKQIESGFIPLGTLLFALASFAVGLLQPLMGGTVVLLICLGAGAGLLIVPLQSLMQSHAPAGKRGAVLAISNTCDIIGLTFGSLIAGAMSLIGLSLPMILCLSSLAALALALWSISLLPAALLRALFLLLIKSRLLRPHFTSSLPEVATLHSTSLSLFDLFVLRALIRRPLHAIIPACNYHRWWVRLLAKPLQISCLEIENSQVPQTSLTLYLHVQPPEQACHPWILLERIPAHAYKNKRRLHAPHYKAIL